MPAKGQKPAKKIPRFQEISRAKKIRPPQRMDPQEPQRYSAKTQTRKSAIQKRYSSR